LIINQLPKEAHINFYAAISKNLKGHNTQVKYDVVLNNDGSGYRMEAGCFIAPTDGVYFFMMNALRCQNSGALYMHMMHNDEIVSSTANLDENFESVSASVFLDLKKGDRVWIKLRVGQVYGHSPSHYTNFMGYRTFNKSPMRKTRDAEETRLEITDLEVGKLLAQDIVSSTLKEPELPYDNKVEEKQM